MFACVNVMFLDAEQRARCTALLSQLHTVGIVMADQQSEKRHCSLHTFKACRSHVRLYSGPDLDAVACALQASMEGGSREGVGGARVFAGRQAIGADLPGSSIEALAVHYCKPMLRGVRTICGGAGW